MMESVITGLVCGLIAWGGIRVELNWIRRDVDELRQTVKACRMVHQ